MDLKPCPFCGGQALMEPYEARKGYEATINCSNCLAAITTITYATRREAEVAVQAAWNKRAE